MHSRICIASEPVVNESSDAQHRVLHLLRELHLTYAVIIVWSGGLDLSP